MAEKECSKIVSRMNAYILDCTYLYMIRVAIKILKAPSSAVEGAVEKDYEPVVCHVQHQLMRLGYAKARLGNIDFRWKVILPTTELQTERRVSNPISGVKAWLSNSLHLCDAELVCSLANPETRKVAAIVGSISNPDLTTTWQSDIHSIGNFPSDLHERTCRSEGAGDVVRGFIFLRWPASQVWIQLRCDERNWDGFGVHRRRCAEFPSDV